MGRESGLVLFVTGHRPDKIGGYTKAVDDKLVSLASESLADIRPSVVITGMALGWDTAIAVACASMGVPFDAYVPFREQSSLWTREAKAKYVELLSKARKVLFVCPPGYAPWKMALRNKMMVDHSNQGLALWNGDEEGGTANCLRYARLKLGEKNIVNVWDRWREVSR